MVNGALCVGGGACVGLVEGDPFELVCLKRFDKVKPCVTKAH